MYCKGHTARRNTENRTVTPLVQNDYTPGGGGVGGGGFPGLVKLYSLPSSRGLAETPKGLVRSEASNGFTTPTDSVDIGSADTDYLTEITFELRVVNFS